MIGSDSFRDRLGYWMERAERGEELLVTFRGRPRFRVVPAEQLATAPVAQEALESLMAGCAANSRTTTSDA
jgi:prevent-host-death family protein